MAGHSHAKTIKHRKNGQDAKRAKIFTKIQREIVIAVKAAGSDDKINAKLRLAKQKARLVNMPNDKINDAIKRAIDTSISATNYEECYYLISCGGGIFLLIKSLTDNKNRSASEIRGVTGKYNASIAESSNIDFLFTNIGVIKYESKTNSLDEIFEVAIEAGALDVLEAEMEEETEEETITHNIIEITTEFKIFNQVKTTLEEKFGEPKIAETEWRAQNITTIPEEASEKIQNLIEALEELDDVSSIYKNFN